MDDGGEVKDEGSKTVLHFDMIIVLSIFYCQEFPSWR